MVRQVLLFNCNFFVFLKYLPSDFGCGECPEGIVPDCVAVVFAAVVEQAGHGLQKGLFIAGRDKDASFGCDDFGYASNGGAYNRNARSKCLRDYAWEVLKIGEQHEEVRFPVGLRHLG